MAKKPTATIFTKQGGEIKEGSLKAALNEHRKIHGIKKGEPESMWKLVLKGEELTLPPRMDVQTTRKMEKAFAALKKLHSDSAKLQSEDEKAKAKQEQESQQRGQRLMVATGAGFARANAGVDAGMATLQTTIGKKFILTATGLTPAQDVKITEEDAGQLISCLTRTTDGLGAIQSAVSWALGDAVVFIEENFDEGEQLIEQIISETGKTKHTITEARRLAKAFPQDQRHAELSMTHHQEIFNYREGVKPARLEKIIDEIKVAKVNVIKTKDGKEIKQAEAGSCSQLRKLLQESSETSKESKKGKRPKKAGPVVTAEAPAQAISPGGYRGYLYLAVDGEAGNFHHQELSKDAVKSEKFMIIDLDAMVVLNDDGTEGKGIGQLPPVWFNKDEPANKPTPAAKPEKKAAAKKESTKAAVKAPEVTSMDDMPD